MRLSRPTETVNHLEVLHRVCERKGWKMGLRVDGFPGELTTLDVTDRDRELIARCGVNDQLTVWEAAVAVLEGLQRSGQVP